MLQVIGLPRRGRGWNGGRWLAVAMAALLGAWTVAAPRGAEAAAYVGVAIADVKPEDKAVVASPQPVQLLFEFKTKGAPNARATKALKAKVVEAVTGSGVFSTVTETPAANGAVLSVVIDNVVDPEAMKKAQGDGVKTGATLFIAGSNITDNYVATLDYVGSPTAAKITRTANHSVIMQMGMINKPPENAVKIGGMMDAIYVMTRQIVTNPLNEIARDPAFNAPAPAAAPEAAPAAAPAPEPATAPAASEPAPAPAPAPAPEPAPAPAPTPAPKA